ncbi:MAG: M1 family metallopeptidase [Bacteroidota bacterium]
MMRALLLFGCLMSAALVSAQQMISGSEWCAESHQYAAPPVQAPDFRSDSIDILNTAIVLNVTAPPQLSAVCRLSLQAKLGQIHSILLDLEGLTVDSVRWNDVKVPFSYASPALRVAIPGNWAAGQNATIEVTYHGTPVTDGSGWGGVYNQSGYYYNLGVGFAADPHSFGRAWFPCFDNFVERCSFDITVTSQASKPAYCNGYLALETPIGPSLVLRRWKLDEPIPSYLACFATGPYVSFKRKYQGEAAMIPVEIACAAADTNKVAGTFINLPGAIAAFEHWYGPFRWNKIGYSLVPFNSGAMEHATNIAMMKSAIDGSIANETLWAHELSHHWWGDLATCSTAEDMWLNEGWASYSEHLFTEWVHGNDAFQAAVWANFIDVLQNAHVAEGGYLAVSGVPHDLTYGTHVYHKGAVVAHNLRGYLGDESFRQGLRTILYETQFEDWSSAEMRDKLSAATGRDLTDFFNDWVFSGGYAHFSVDSFRISDVPVDTAIYIIANVKQKLRGAPHFHQQVPLEFTLINAQMERIYRTAVVSGENSTVGLSVPLSFGVPKFCWVNTRQKLLLARAEKERAVSATGQISFAPAKLDLKVNAVPDPAFIRTEYHFAMPDTAYGANPFNFTLTNRYWSIDGVIPPSFDATANVFYDGRGQLDQLDRELFLNTSPSEDSLIVVYRPGAGFPWTEWPTYSKLTLNSNNDKYGLMRIDHVRAGEYTIAKGKTIVGTETLSNQLFEAKVSPNPAQSTLHIQSELEYDRVVLIKSDGSRNWNWKNASTNRSDLDVRDIPTGSYWILLYGKKGMAIKSVVLVK